MKLCSDLPVNFPAFSATRDFDHNNILSVSFGCDSIVIQESSVATAKGTSMEVTTQSCMQQNLTMGRPISVEFTNWLYIQLVIYIQLYILKFPSPLGPMTRFHLV